MGAGGRYRSFGDADVTVWSGGSGQLQVEVDGPARKRREGLHALALPFPLLLALGTPLTSCPELVRSLSETSSLQFVKICLLEEGVASALLLKEIWL